MAGEREERMPLRGADRQMWGQREQRGVAGREAWIMISVQSDEYNRKLMLFPPLQLVIISLIC